MPYCAGKIDLNWLRDAIKATFGEVQLQRLDLLTARLQPEEALHLFGAFALKLLTALAFPNVVINTSNLNVRICGVHASQHDRNAQLFSALYAELGGPLPSKALKINSQFMHFEFDNLYCSLDYEPLATHLISSIHATINFKTGEVLFNTTQDYFDFCSGLITSMEVEKILASELNEQACIAKKSTYQNPVQFLNDLKAITSRRYRLGHLLYAASCMANQGFKIRQDLQNILFDRLDKVSEAFTSFIYDKRKPIVFEYDVLLYPGTVSEANWFFQPMIHSRYWTESIKYDLTDYANRPLKLPEAMVAKKNASKVDAVAIPSYQRSQKKRQVKKDSGPSVGIDPQMLLVFDKDINVFNQNLRDFIKLCYEITHILQRYKYLENAIPTIERFVELDSSLIDPANIAEFSDLIFSKIWRKEGIRFESVKPFVQKHLPKLAEAASGDVDSIESVTSKDDSSSEEDVSLGSSTASENSLALVPKNQEDQAAIVSTVLDKKIQISSEYRCIYSKERIIGGLLVLNVAFSHLPYLKDYPGTLSFYFLCLITWGERQKSKKNATSKFNKRMNWFLYKASWDVEDFSKIICEFIQTPGCDFSLLAGENRKLEFLRKVLRIHQVIIQHHQFKYLEISDYGIGILNALYVYYGSLQKAAEQEDLFLTQSSHLLEIKTNKKINDYSKIGDFYLAMLFQCRANRVQRRMLMNLRRDEGLTLQMVARQDFNIVFFLKAICFIGFIGCIIYRLLSEFTDLSVTERTVGAVIVPLGFLSHEALKSYRPNYIIPKLPVRSNTGKKKQLN